MGCAGVGVSPRAIVYTPLTHSFTYFDQVYGGNEKQSCTRRPAERWRSSGGRRWHTLLLQLQLEFRSRAYDQPAIMQEERDLPQAVLLQSTNSTLDGDVVVVGGVQARNRSVERSEDRNLQPCHKHPEFGREHDHRPELEIPRALWSSQRGHRQNEDKQIGDRFKCGAVRRRIWPSRVEE